MFLFTATDSYTQLDEVIVEIPAAWGQACFDSPLTSEGRLSSDNVDILVNSGFNQFEAVQTEPCGIKGDLVKVPLSKISTPAGFSQGKIRLENVSKIFCGKGLVLQAAESSPRNGSSISMESSASTTSRVTRYTPSFTK